MLALLCVAGPRVEAEDWPRFLGPRHDATSMEQGLATWPETGLKKLWEHEKGEGWACPAIVGDKVVLLSRRDGQEVLECLEAATGKAVWRFAYDAPYRDRYGSSEGPRTAPVIAEQRVYVFGVTGLLHCVELGTGKVIWKRDLAREYAMLPNFFGWGSTPLVKDGRVIVNVGGTGNRCAVALDAATGKELWTASHEWGASYASPVPAKIHGRDCILLFAGGESRPPTGGLLCIDEQTGKVLTAAPHRARIAESVSASSPVVIGNHVFVTESYGSGGVMIEILPDWTAKVAWIAKKFGAYFMMPIVRDGCLFGFDGQQPRLAELVCYDVQTGKELWRDDLGSRFGRGSLLSLPDQVLCLGEFGDLARLELSRAGVKIAQQAKLFHAPETWTLPALSDGRLYVCQNERSADRKAPRLLCYDFTRE